MLEQALIFLAAAALVVPISKRLGFGAVLGYLAAGIVIGPSLTGWIDDVEGILHFSEIGVVFLLFIIGLELQPHRLKVLRKSVFGFGAAQVVATAALLAAAAAALGQDLRTALVAGSALSLSSTAFVLQMLAEKKELIRPHGRAAFGILLFQDLAVIPMLAFVPLLAGGVAAAADAGASWFELARAAVVLVAFVLVGRHLLRPLLRLVAAAEIHEIFTAAALLLVIGSALLMEWLGFSMGLGAFLAGVLVADSEYRHQLESDIEPFKGLLLGLFFIAVGMSTDLGLLATQPIAIVTVTVALMALKATVLVLLAQSFGLRGRQAVALGLLLSQGGEFGFVIFTLAAGQNVLPESLAAVLTLVVTLSMALTPVVYLVFERLTARLEPAPERPYDRVETDDHEVVICGFGRFGQIMARVLNMRRIPFTALEIDPRQVDFVKRFGNKIYYGDASRLDILLAARLERARILVIAVDDVQASVRIAETARRHFPRVTVYARARDRRHALALMQAGAKIVIRDTLHSSLELTTRVLEGLGIDGARAREAVGLFERHDAALLERQLAIRDDEEALVQSARNAARELRELFESDASGQSKETKP